jgi:restriction endonuclease S subunit
MKNIDNFIKGKNNEIDIEKIKDFDILNLSHNTQNTINNYITTSNKLISSNNDNINMNNILKKSILDNIPDNKMIILEKVVDLIQEESNNFYISIIKNSLLAGEVSLHQGKLNNNSYYLVPKNNNFILEYIYYYLKYKEIKIKEMSRLTQQYNLIKSKLLNLYIPDIDVKLQNEIIHYCKEFDNNIKSLESNNESIKNKDIFEIILKINSY